MSEKLTIPSYTVPSFFTKKLIIDGIKRILFFYSINNKYLILIYD